MGRGGLSRRACVVTLAGLHVLLAGAAAQPSFNCLRATSIAEKEICADPELAALDRRLHLTFETTRRRLSRRPAMVQALIRDQKAFLIHIDRLIENMKELRPETDAATRGFYHPGPPIEARISLLERIEPEARDGFAGRWGGADGWVLVGGNGDAISVRVRAGRETLDLRGPQQWSCTADGLADFSGNGLRVSAAPGADWDGFGLRLERDGGMLEVHVAEPRRGGQQAANPFCEGGQLLRAGELFPLAEPELERVDSR
jgi:uncharacterized protein YecT (DUF1311 family)